MRIGIDARMYSSNFTGIGRYNFELINNLLKLDSKNHYFVFLRKKEFESATFLASNITKVLADFKHYSFQEQFFFPRLLKKYNLDIVHFTHFNAPILFSGPKIFVTIHDLTLSLYPGKKMTSWIYRFGYYITVRSIVKKAHKIIAVSENTKKDIIEQFRVKKDKIQVIYEGVNNEFAPMKNENTLNEIRKTYNLVKPFLLYTGVWRDHKNVTGLIRAFAKLVHEEKRDIDLVITGREDPSYLEVKDTIIACNVSDRVKLVGLVPEEHLIGLYSLAAVYVFPSFYEGFGLPPLEAMACHTPVCASNTSSIPEICGEGNVVFFDPHNVDDMAKNILKVLNDPELQSRLVENGKKRIADFSWEKMGKEMFQLYTSQ